tara:strand:+ start:204 stop:437 length:234 start_codon:yes stop_codon:yes gene_type:complete
VSAVRFLLVVATLLAAVLCVPASLVPVLNTADLIVGAAPIVIILIVATGRSPKTPAGGDAPNVADPHADAPPAGPRI